MAKIYYRRIMEGKMTLDQVPLKWREEVRRMLEPEGTYSGSGLVAEFERQGL